MAEAPTPHADHDGVVVATLLDRDATPQEVAAGEAMIAACQPCATLYADLVGLAAATRSMPIPARPRAFTLSPTEAARLVAPSQAEPDAGSARPTTVMTDPRGSKGHPAHDTTLVAALADHSLSAADRDAAEALVAACTMCADLKTDVVSLRNATRSLPAPVRPREFMLSEADAARLRPAGWRRLLTAFGTSRDAVSQPLALGLTTLGLAGLLITGVPTVLQGAGGPSAGASSAESDQARQSLMASDGLTGPAANGAPEVAPSARALVVPSSEAAGPDIAGEPSAAPPDRVTAQGSAGPGGSTAEPIAGAASSGDPAPSPADGQDLSDGTALKQVAPEDAETSKVVIVAGTFLIIGLSLFAFRWTARRFGNG